MVGNRRFCLPSPCAEQDLCCAKRCGHRSTNFGVIFFDALRVKIREEAVVRNCVAVLQEPVEAKWGSLAVMQFWWRNHWLLTDCLIEPRAA